MQFLADLCVLVVVIDPLYFSCGHQLLKVFGSEEAGGGRRRSGKTLEMHGWKLELGRGFLSYNLHVVKTISGALCCGDMSHSCLPCKYLMYLNLLILVALSHGEPFASIEGKP